MDLLKQKFVYVLVYKSGAILSNDEWADDQDATLYETFEEAKRQITQCDSRFSGKVITLKVIERSDWIQGERI